MVKWCSVFPADRPLATDWSLCCWFVAVGKQNSQQNYQQAFCGAGNRQTDPNEPNLVVLRERRLFVEMDRKAPPPPLRRVQLAKKTIGKWLVGHCPAAKFLTGQCLGVVGANPQLPGGGGRRSNGNAPQETGVRVSLETMAGTSIGVSQFKLSQLVGDVRIWLAKSQPLKYTAASRVLLFVPGDDSKLEPVVNLASLVKLHPETPETPHRLTLLVAVSTARWSHKLSNTTLVFSDNDRSITRPGGQSSFPCGMSERKLNGPGDGFSVLITALPLFSNALTVGIISHGCEFELQGSNGIGGERGSMGFHVANVKYQAEQPPRQLVQVNAESWLGPERGIPAAGDRLRFAIRESDPKVPAEADTELVLDIFYNHELFCAAPIPKSFDLPFQPACTLCNDATLTLEN